MVEDQKQSCTRLCRFVRLGRYAFLLRLGSGLDKAPGCVVNASGAYTQICHRLYRWRPLPRHSLPVLFKLPTPR